MLRRDRHLWLYAKNHYHKHDLISDMAKLIGDMCGVEPKFVTPNDIVIVMLPLTFLCIGLCGNPEHEFMRFVQEVAYNNESTETIISRTLALMALTPLSDIDGLLGYPDPNLLYIME